MWLEASWSRDWQAGRSSRGVRLLRRDSCFLMSCALSGFGFSYVIPHFSRLKRPLEQAQPSMAKKLKVGAVSRGSG